MEVLKPGTLFAGRYRILRRLSEGGMGAVYVALQEATELEVALKVLWPHILQRSEAVERFALEAKIAARIKSDHIVQVFDAGFDSETQMPFLVMELLKGVTLQNLVEKGGPCAHAETLELLTQVARGLDRAHAYVDAEGKPAPVIHRDLKPDNLFVTRRETGEPLVKILDYGIAKILSQSTSLSREIKGTPLYMAYEQASGTALSPQTDLWALGLIAFFMLTGSNYWKSTRSAESSLSALITEIVAMPIEPPSLRVREFAMSVSLPPAFDAWFQRCVNREPTARFGSAGEAVLALASALSTATPVANSVSPWVFDTTLTPQSRVAQVVAQAQNAAMINQPLQTGASPTGAGPEPTLSPASVTQREVGALKKSKGFPLAIAAGGLAAAVVVVGAMALRSGNSAGNESNSPPQLAAPQLQVSGTAPKAETPVLQPAIPSPVEAAPPVASAEGSAAPSSGPPAFGDLKPKAPQPTVSKQSLKSTSAKSTPLPTVLSKPPPPKTSTTGQAKTPFNPLQGPRVY